jgi:hypothetical protein
MPLYAMVQIANGEDTSPCTVRVQKKLPKRKIKSNAAANEEQIAGVNRATGPVIQTDLRRSHTEQRVTIP